jgi:hypothetical protein
MPTAEATAVRYLTATEIYTKVNVTKLALRDTGVRPPGQDGMRAPDGHPLLLRMTKAHGVLRRTNPRHGAKSRRPCS